MQSHIDIVWLCWRDKNYCNNNCNQYIEISYRKFTLLHRSGEFKVKFTSVLKICLLANERYFSYVMNFLLFTIRIKKVILMQWQSLPGASLREMMEWRKKTKMKSLELI